MSHFRSAARLGARLSQAKLDPVDEVAIATIAEETLARVLSTSEETLRTVLRNAVASPHHCDWWLDVHGEYIDNFGNLRTMAGDWRRNLAQAVMDYFERGRGLKPYWAERKRALTVLEGGRMPSRRRRRTPELQLLQGGAP